MSRPRHKGINEEGLGIKIFRVCKGQNLSRLSFNLVVVMSVCVVGRGGGEKEGERKKERERVN